EQRRAGDQVAAVVTPDWVAPLHVAEARDGGASRHLDDVEVGTPLPRRVDDSLGAVGAERPEPAVLSEWQCRLAACQVEDLDLLLPADRDVPAVGAEREPRHAAVCDGTLALEHHLIAGR